MTRRITQAFGAALLAATLLSTGWMAARTWDRSVTDLAGDALGARDPHRWALSTDLRETVLGQLPSAFERRARQQGHVVPPLSNYDLHVQGETRLDGKHLVTVQGECRPELLAPAPPPAPADATPTPAPAFPPGCFLSAAYDPDASRFVVVSLDDGRSDLLAPQIDCRQDNFQAVTRLAALPPEIRISLQATGDVAEHGAPFQSTDVVGPERLPWRRFDLAAVGDRRAIVALEHGGIGYSIEAWLFERRDGHWEGEPRWTGVARANSLQALLSGSCIGVPAPPMRDLSVAERIYAFDRADGALELILVDQPSAQYTLRPRFQGTPEGLVEASSHKPLSPEERRALRQRLRALDREVLADQPAHGPLSRFLAALARDDDRK